MSNSLFEQKLVAFTIKLTNEQVKSVQLWKPVQEIQNRLKTIFSVKMQPGNGVEGGGGMQYAL